MEQLIFTVYLVKGYNAHRFIFAINEDNLDDKLLDDETPVYHTHYFHDSLSGYIELLVDHLGFEETGELVCSMMQAGFYQGRKYFQEIKENDKLEFNVVFFLDKETYDKLLLALNENDIEEIAQECQYFGIKPIIDLNEEIIFNYSFN